MNLPNLYIFNKKMLKNSLKKHLYWVFVLFSILALKYYSREKNGNEFKIEKRIIMI